MHTLIRYLLDHKKVSIQELIGQSGDDIVLKDPANVIQFCFVKLADALEKKEFSTPDESTDVLIALVTLLQKNQAAFTDPIYISTIFHTLGSIAFSNKMNGILVKISWPFLNELLLAFSKNEQLSDKTIATLLHGLGQLKDGGAFPSEEEQQPISQATALDLMKKLCDCKPSAQAIAMVIFGLARLQVTNWTQSNKEQLDALLSTAIQAFLGLEQSAWSNEKKPKAQELSNIVYALAKLSKQGALIPTAWRLEARQKMIHELIQLMFKKKPSQLAINQIFYALGKLAETECLMPHNDLFWLMSSLIKYLVYTLSPVDHRTAITIFTALGRLAERDFLVKDNWQQDGAVLLDKLLEVDFTKPHDIADLYLSLGRLAENDILTLKLWDKHKNKILSLIDKFKRGPTEDIYKRAFVNGMQKLNSKGFIDQKQNDDTRSFNRSPSVSPILDQLRLTYEDEAPNPSQHTSDNNNSSTAQTPTRK